MPATKAVDGAKAVPSVAAAYHLIPVPEVVTKLATVPELQKACAAAVGAAVTVIVTNTEVLPILSQVPMV